MIPSNGVEWDVVDAKPPCKVLDVFHVLKHHSFFCIGHRQINISIKRDQSAPNGDNFGFTRHKGSLRIKLLESHDWTWPNNGRVKMVMEREP
jgi:hypothetical protein